MTRGGTTTASLMRSSPVFNQADKQNQLSAELYCIGVKPFSGVLPVITHCPHSAVTFRAEYCHRSRDR